MLLDELLELLLLDELAPTLVVVVWPVTCGAPYWGCRSS